MAKKNKKQEFYWHESARARILLPSGLAVERPFPELYAPRKKSLTSIIALISSHKPTRSTAEHMITESLTYVGPIRCELVRRGAITAPYPGIERIVQQYHDMSGPGYYWKRLCYLDRSREVFLHIQVQGDGLFTDFEEMWRTVLDSFSWDPSQTVVLKFDGDEVAFRARYAKKRKSRRVKAGSLPQMPPELKYLQPFMDELMTYPPEEINEDLDATLLDNLIKERIKGLSSEEAENRLMADAQMLDQWLAEAKEGTAQAGFIQGYFDGFTVYGFGSWWEQGEKTAKVEISEWTYHGVLVQRLITPA